ncbi:MAG: HAD family hydrolase [Zhaonellaceae bacterium]|jgi:soluble P-type ATPase|nr:ATPase P [Clostridia bacterium]
MITIDIPGRDILQIENVVFDYNGTLATDGTVSKETKDKLTELQELVNIYILTADTHGTVRENVAFLRARIETFPKENAGKEKARIVEGLDQEHTICIGNGYNDLLMAQRCALFICVLGQEGCNGKLLTLADVVVTSIEDALNLLLKPKRLVATLRN